MFSTQELQHDLAGRAQVFGQTVTKYSMLSGLENWSSLDV